MIRAPSFVLVVALCGLISPLAIRGRPSAAAGSSRGTPPATVSSQGLAAEAQDTVERRAVASVVSRFIEAVQKRDWKEASSLFAADFRRAQEKTLRDGSLLRYRWGIRKSAQSVLHDPRCRMTEIIVRGDFAWARAEVSGGRWAQGGAVTLELARERGSWRLLRFPPSAASADAVRAGFDGEAAGHWLQAMLEDRRLSQQELVQIAAVLPAYYAVLVERVSARQPRLLRSLRPHIEVIDATTDDLKRLPAGLAAPPDSHVQRLVFWRFPSKQVQAASRALARQAIHRIYDDLIAVKAKYPELAQFDAGHVRLTGTGLWYAPVRSDYEKVTAPTIGVGIDRPYLGATQFALPAVLLPRQQLAVTRQVRVKDKTLEQFAEQAINKCLAPLAGYEGELGGEPLRMNYW